MLGQQFEQSGYNGIGNGVKFIQWEFFNFVQHGSICDGCDVNDVGYRHWQDTGIHQGRA